ncbi:hypothetical protein MNV49_004932 [Pseudohyphozyma bogoriensis]|nr:hypothetical protein MNV49_004932 [Pseudohyphozyma bogoriensis]
MLRAALAGLVLALHLGSPVDAAVTPRSTILYQNDGNWTTHAENPSAILYFDPVTFEDAQSTCAGENESLIDTYEVSTFWQPLQYQAYLGTISKSPKFWTSDDVGTASSNATYPFICTNSAPLVDTGVPPYYLYPKVNVSSNGTTFIGVRDHMTYRFLGVPPVLPVVGDLRLAYPVQWYSNTSNPVVNATVFGPGCFSGSYSGNSSYNPWGQSEDCVSINIFTPYLPGAEKSTDTKALKPVMYWVHGGSTTPSDPSFEPAGLITRSDIVLVSVSYRQGTAGSLTLDDGFVTGNYGIADLVAGLQWIHDHIEAFGGNPKNVTIFGQSAGGESAMSVVKSPKAKGLITGAILQSAALGPTVTPEQVANYSVPAVAKVCPNVTDAARLACLRSLPFSEFRTNISYSLGPNYAQIDGGAIVDGVWLTNSTVAAMRAGQVNDIYYMSGSMPEEGQSLLGTSIAPNATNFTATMDSLAGSQYQTYWPQNVTDSGLWKNGSDPINAYNQTINVFTTMHLTCPGQQVIHAAYESGAFKDMYLLSSFPLRSIFHSPIPQPSYYYSNTRAYGLGWFDAEAYNLCTFPVGSPTTPYYRCHSGDVYQVFGGYNYYQEPIRTTNDIGHGNLVQDMWGAFARTGNPNPALKYLEAKGYHDSYAVFKNYQWPKFEGKESVQISYPTPKTSELPWAEKCAFVEEVYQLP